MSSAGPSAGRFEARPAGSAPEIPPGGSPFAYDTCAGSTVAPVLKLDLSGNVMQSFGADMFIFPHKIHVDREGNVWVVDERSANERERKKHPRDKAKGHTVVKFSPEGEVLRPLTSRTGMQGSRVRFDT